jgi:hypothetical protein
MAIEENGTKSGRMIPGLACTLPYLLGMALFYVGEKLVASPPVARFALDGVGAAFLLWAVSARAANWLRSRGDRRSVEGMILAAYLGGIVALALYAAQLEPVREGLLPPLEGAKALERYRGILRVLWPIAWVSSVLPLLFMEISFASMARAPRIERRRVAFSAASGLAVAWLGASLFLINFVADTHNRKWDLTFQRSFSPSEGARSLVANLSEPFEVLLFYPEANEVLEELSSYFEGLKGRSDLLRVRVHDHALEPKLAKELGVRGNGNVVYRYGDSKEVVRIGTEMGEARGRIARVDDEFRSKFLKLVTQRRVAYLITGHGERAYDWQREEDPRPPVTALKKVLQGQNFEVKPLGLGQGLGSEVPEDAYLLAAIDPTENFLPEELESLRRYLRGGGRMWVALDPEHASNLAGMLEDFGLRFQAVPLANERHFMRAFHTKADRYNLYSNRTSSHPSVNTLSQNASRLAVVLLGSGYLEKVEGPKSGAKVVMTLRSMPMTWADENRNLEQDGPEQQTENFNLAAAVTAEMSEKKDETSEDAPAGASGKKGSKQTRMIVMADADALSDPVIGNPGNYFFFEDGLKWLFQEESLSGSAETEEDVRILHTREQDVVWFYTTIFAVPLFVLGTGLVYNRLRARRTRRGRKA